MLREYDLLGPLEGVSGLVISVDKGVNLIANLAWRGETRAGQSFGRENGEPDLSIKAEARFAGYITRDDCSAPVRGADPLRQKRAHAQRPASRADRRLDPRIWLHQPGADRRRGRHYRRPRPGARRAFARPRRGAVHRPGAPHADAAPRLCVELTRFGGQFVT